MKGSIEKRKVDGRDQGHWTKPSGFLLFSYPRVEANQLLLYSAVRSFLRLSSLV